MVTNRIHTAATYTMNAFARDIDDRLAVRLRFRVQANINCFEKVDHFGVDRDTILLQNSRHFLNK